MKFINKGKDQQVRIEVLKNDVNGPSGFSWRRVKTGETIDLPKDVGKRYGFEKVSNGVQKLPETTEGKIGEKKVETKQFEKDKRGFYNTLIKIKGIAKKTAEDIIEIFTEEKLIDTIIKKQKLPFRDDVEKKLRRKYG